ncbi:MAG: hypothetical protein [Podoviridae sp. ctLUJ1]|nr:MAG: hypothetical protein [Podoviridae sp. ctLUJ1]
MRFSNNTIVITDNKRSANTSHLDTEVIGY